MKRWEYLRVIVNEKVEGDISYSSFNENCFECTFIYFVENLPKFGEDGWELVSHSDYQQIEVHMFKREKQPLAQSAPAIEI